VDGLATALRWAAPEPVLLLACDLVEPDAAAMARVVATGRSAGADVTVPVVAGREQWLHAWWAPTAAPVVDAALAAGERALHAVAAGLVAHRYEEHDGRPFADADTEADLPPDGR
jgi:molybdopterin-guanine dinucleotide biosynthesis protein A